MVKQRTYEDNATRQAAYRERLRKKNKELEDEEMQEYEDNSLKSKIFRRYKGKIQSYSHSMGTHETLDITLYDGTELHFEQ
jgi:hypothetical protein